MFDKEKAQERLSRLSGGVAVFKVRWFSLSLFFFMVFKDVISQHPMGGPIFHRLVGPVRQRLVKGRIE